MYGTCKLLSQFTLVSSHKYEGGSQYIMWISKMLVSVDIHILYWDPHWNSSWGC